MKTLLLLLTIAFASSVYGQAWPEPRFGHSMVVIGDYAYVYGGMSVSGSDTTYFGDLWKLDLLNYTWEEIVTKGPNPGERANHTAVSDDEMMAIFFGSNGEGWQDMPAWAYDPGANTWAEIPPVGQQPFGRIDCAGSMTGANTAVFTGGKLEDGTYSDESWMFDFNSSIWSAGPMFPGGHSGHGTFVFDGNFFSFGGYEYFESGGTGYHSFRNDIWFMDWNTWMMWVYYQMTGTIPPEIAFFGQAFDKENESYYIVGGSTDATFGASTNFYQLELGGTNAGTWNKKVECRAVKNAKAVVQEDTSGSRKPDILVFGGINLLNQPVNTLMQYSTKNDEWKEILPTAIDDEKPMPYTFELRQNFPNPFNPSTDIYYTLKKASAVELAVYNQLGEEVALLVNKEESAGVHHAVFDAGKYNLASGIYIYTLRAGDFFASKKMMLVK